MMKKAKVYYKNLLAGHLSETDEGYEFLYNEDYLLNKEAKAVSLTLPLRKEVYKSNVLFPFFDGLIPEGWLLDVAVDYWKVKSNDRFEILLATCADAIGAVSIIPE